MNHNHKPVNVKQDVPAGAVKKDSVTNVKKNVEVKNQAGNAAGETCEINPAKGISYLPPKDENEL